MTIKVIELGGGEAGQFIVNEALSAAASTIVPGDLIEVTTAGTVQEHSTAAANAQKLFALPNIANGGGIDDAYLAAETVRYGKAHSGQAVYARVAAAAAAIVIGDALESAGDGTLRKVVTAAATPDTARDSIVAYATEAVDNSGGGTVVRIQAEVA
jgi:hypothetical protein